MTKKLTLIYPLISTLLLLSFTSVTANAVIVSIKTMGQPIDNDLYTYVKSDDGCYLYKPRNTFGETVKWQGNCEAGYAEGQGIAKWYNDSQLASRYQGTFTHGKLKGLGRIDWEVATNCDFDHYQGTFIDSMPMGVGVMQFTDGNRYQGEYVPNGQLATGIFTWGQNSDHNSDRYEGTFLNGRRKQGTYTWGEYSPWAGDVYEGDYYKDRHHGHGVYTEGNGTRYEGQWKNNQRSGYGEIFQSNGDIYKGGWKNDLRDGNGEITWSDGKRYEGQILEGQIQGQGKLYADDRLIYEGQFAYGEPNGHGKAFYSEGGWAEGSFSDGALSGEGEGIQVRANGIRYAGSWQEGKAWGFGHLTAPRAAYDDDKRAVNGVWQGDTFVEKGWFYDNKFKFPCDSTADCKLVAAKDATKQAYLANSDNYVE